MDKWHHKHKKKKASGEHPAVVACKTATIAEKRAHKLVKKTLKEMGFHRSAEEEQDPEREKHPAVASAELAEKHAERLVQRTLNRIGWQ